MEIKELLLRVKADLGSVKEATSGINSSIGGMMSDIKSKVGGGMASVGSAVKGVASVAAATTTAAIGASGAITGMAVSTAESMSEIQKFADQTGTSVEEYQRLDAVMKQSGWSMEQAAGDFSALSEKMSDSMEGSGEAYEMFEKLGVAVTDSSGKLRNSGDVFNDTIKSLQNIENATERSAMASVLLGTTGEELASTLKMTNAEFDAAKDKASFVDQASIDNAMEFQKTWQEVTTELKNMGTGIMTSVMPMLTDVFKIIVDNMPMIQGMFETLGPVVADTLGNLLPPLMEMAQAILPVLLDLFNQLVPALTGIMSDVLPIITDLLIMIIPFMVEIIKTLLPPLLSIIQALLPVLNVLIGALKPILDIFIALLKPIVDIITSAITPLINIVGTLLSIALKPLIDIINILVTLFTTNLTDAIQGIKGVIDGAIKVFTGLINFITGVFTDNWKKAWEGLSDVVKGIFDALVSIIRAHLNMLIKGLNSLIKGINKVNIDVPDWVPGIGGKQFGFNIPEIPKLADGAVIGPNNPFLAILGDQTSGVNIETPLDTMLQAFKIALNDMNYNGGGQGTGFINQGTIITTSRDMAELWELLKQYAIRDGILLRA